MADDVVVLISGIADRPRLGAALQAAGYRVTRSRPAAAGTGTRRPPVLVTDDTVDAARLRTEMTAAAPGTACVVLVRDPTPARYWQLLASGTTALPADSADEDVVCAVEAATRALVCLPAAVARTGAGPGGDRPALTPREASWLRALAAGETVAGLARGAGYSQREMYRLLKSLYGRMGAGNRTEALLRADRWGLLGPPAGS